MNSQNRPFYLPWIDGLRAIAALSVIVHHGPTLRSMPTLKNCFGWFGVDLFLVLSAFLLCRLMQLEYAKDRKIDVKNFFIRRILRIWPLYFFFTTASFLYALSIHFPAPREALGWFLAHVTFTQNIAASVHSYSTLPFAAQLWTIGLEEQAYLLMPILVWAYLRNEDPVKLTKITVFVTLAFMVARLSIVLLGRTHPYIYVTPLRSDTFLCGAYLALGTSVGAQRMKRTTTYAFMGLTGIVILVLLAAWMKPPGVSTVTEVIGYPVVGALCCALIFTADQSKVAGFLLGSPVMRWLGKISYGIYVFHLFGLWAAERLSDHLASPSPSKELLIAVAISIFLADISYRVIEKPFLMLKERFASIASRPA